MRSHDFMRIVAVDHTTLIFSSPVGRGRDSYGYDSCGRAPSAQPSAVRLMVRAVGHGRTRESYFNLHDRITGTTSRK